MKKILSLKYLLGALFAVVTFTACDKFKEDVPPARMETLILNDDYFDAVVNQPLQLNVLANDSIGGTATLQFGQPLFGTIQTANSNPVYQPNPNFTGKDTFSYQACLGNNCATAMVYIEVRSSDTCKVRAYNDGVNSYKNMSFTKNVFQYNNLCQDTTATSVTITQGPAHGQAWLNSRKHIVYTPATNFIGNDELTYTISNAQGQATAKLYINIQEPPCLIKANPDSASFQRTMGAIDTVSIAVVANDIICPGNGPVNVQLHSGPNTQFGTLMIAYNGQQPRIIYTTKPGTGKNLTDTYQYRICQGNDCSITSVFIYIR